jgi:16S rRNA (guanine527-N7)-methyltransferase
VSSIPPFVPDDLSRLGVEIDGATLDRLAHYLELLLQTNQKFNLTAVRESDEAWRRHVVDSLTLLPGLEDMRDGGRLVDVGSGGGLPGIPLAICLPACEVTLIEVTGKKARFLQDVVATLGLGRVAVVAERAEVVGQDPHHRQSYDVAVCRAIGPMRELLEYTLPLVRVGGRLLAMKGPSLEEELAGAADALDALGAGEVQVVEAYPEGFDVNTVIAIIGKERPTPRSYPRRPGVPRQMPL